MLDCFSSSFDEARRKFRAGAASTGASLHAYTLPGHLGREGEDLTCDVAVLGNPQAAHAVLAVAGTHGVEGYCGSAVLNAWLAKRPEIPAQLRVVLVHAINPWGFSFKCRANENNVDLNRNFLTEWRLTNTAYGRAIPFLHAVDCTAEGMLEDRRNYVAFFDSQGWNLEADLLAGQSAHADGLFYTGTRPEWSNTTFRRILGDHLSGAAVVGYVDWHTGVGQYGETVHLVFDEPPGKGLLPEGWRGNEAGARSFRSASVPPYRGLLSHAVREELANAVVFGGVVEFGTVDDYALFRADRLDRWLRFEGRADPDHDLLREDYLDALCPRDILWRRYVERVGPAHMRRLVEAVLSSS